MSRTAQDRRQDLDAALDAAREPGAEGRARVHDGGVSTEVECREIGPVGVVVDRLRVRGPAGDVAERAAALAEALRPQGERLDAVEVDPALGGAVLRTRPEDMREGRFFEVEVGPDAVELSRHRRRPEGGRAREPYALTREELARTVDAVSGVLGARAAGRGDDPADLGAMAQEDEEDEA